MHAVVGVLSDDADPMVTVMKLEKAPQESYADIGGLDQQIQEIKVQVSKINFNDTNTKQYNRAAYNGKVLSFFSIFQFTIQL